MFSGPCGLWCNLQYLFIRKNDCGFLWVKLKYILKKTKRLIFKIKKWLHKQIVGVIFLLAISYIL